MAKIFINGISTQYDNAEGDGQQGGPTDIDDGNYPVLSDPLRLEANDNIVPRMTVFSDPYFMGESWSVDTGMEYVGTYWNDKISSIIIYSGTFEFYGSIRWGTDEYGPVRLGVGHYGYVETPETGVPYIPDNTISSWKAYYGGGPGVEDAVRTAESSVPSKAIQLSTDANIVPLITFYEDVNLQGESWSTNFGYENLEPDWNDRISSFVIEAGTFVFYEHKQFGWTTWTPVALGIGTYNYVWEQNIQNDSISSLKAYYGGGGGTVPDGDLKGVYIPLPPSHTKPIDPGELSANEALTIDHDPVDSTDICFSEAKPRVYLRNKNRTRNLHVVIQVTYIDSFFGTKTIEKVDQILVPTFVDSDRFDLGCDPSELDVRLTEYTS